MVFPKKDHPQYQIIHAPNSYKLEKLLVEYLELGWEPIGGAYTDGISHYWSLKRELEVKKALDKHVRKKISEMKKKKKDFGQQCIEDGLKAVKEDKVAFSSEKNVYVVV